jgi:branched-chain amino acid transport system substrate-binding protein
MKVKAALLAPLTGPAAAIGLSMQRAALLAQAAGAKPDELIVLDTGGSADGAAAAAKQAVKRGARIIIGPLYAAETSAVIATVGAGFPLLSLSNDERLAGSGAFLMGITATQSVSAILRYARSRGVRRVAILGGSSPWAIQGAAAAQVQRSGLEMVLVAPEAPDLLAALRRAGKGDLPDALLVTEGGDALSAAARAIQGSNLQLLGSQQALDHPAPGAIGAWVAGPDPRAAGDFATRYQAKAAGSSPGSIATLAFDAANIVELLRRGGTVDRAALLAATAFPAVTGPIRFQTDGTALRELAILVAGLDGFTAVDRA